MRIFLFIILGSVLGSFLAWLGRCLMDRREVAARSQCDACRRQLSWWELIPIVSYLGLGARCRTCGVGIELADWGMEVIGAALFGFGAWRFTDTRDFTWWAIIAFCTMLLFYIDVRWMVVPRAFTVVVAFVAVMAEWSPPTVAIVLWTALLGSIFYFFLYAISHGRWVGDGDVGLGFVVGAALGDPVRLGIALLIAHIFGAIVASALLLTKKKQLGDALPMGAFLLPAMWVTLLYFGWLR